MWNDTFKILHDIAFYTWDFQGVKYKLAYVLAFIVMVSIVSIILKGYAESEIFPRLTGLGKPTSREGQIYRNFKNINYARKFHVNVEERKKIE